MGWAMPLEPPAVRGGDRVGRLGRAVALSDSLPCSRGCGPKGCGLRRAGPLPPGGGLSRGCVRGRSRRDWFADGRGGRALGAARESSAADVGGRPRFWHARGRTLACRKAGRARGRAGVARQRFTPRFAARCASARIVVAVPANRRRIGRAGNRCARLAWMSERGGRTGWANGAGGRHEKSRCGSRERQRACWRPGAAARYTARQSAPRMRQAHGVVRIRGVAG